ncbi:JmjC domain-containing protein [Schlesneria sp.]|uniref:JmjC domain-containing protein n=1 Tax=Schlesneria sp. TaxID=2762018 RepID=UPI002EF93725
MLENSPVVASALPNGLDLSFLQDFYLRLPFLKREGCFSLGPLGSTTVLARLLATAGADVIATRQGHISQSTDYEALRADGYTVGVRHAQQHDQGLANLARGFEELLKGPVDIHFYATPAGNRGFDWHYDAEEVFVLQTGGAKTWWLKKNTVNPWPLMDAIPQDQRFEREVMGAVKYELHEGDWLYIPSGYWHRTSAETDSCSLSVGIRAATAMDVYELLRPLLFRSLLWRQRLPLPGSTADPDGLRRQYGAIVDDLAQDLYELLHNEQFIQTMMNHPLRH